MAMETPVPLNRKVKYFAAAVDDALPYVKASRSYLSDQLSGKKMGDTYFFYIPDPGTASVGTKDLDISSMNKNVHERVIAATIVSGKAAVDLTAWNKMQSIENYVDEIANPRGRRVAAEIEKDIIAKNVWISDNAFVVPKVNGNSGLNFATFQLLASKLRGVKAAGKKVGFAHPNLFGETASKFLSAFIPSEIQSRIYNDVYLGDYAKVSWIEENFMPCVEVGATLPAITKATFHAPVVDGQISATDGTISVTGTNLFVGAAFTATYTDPITSATKSYGTIDLNGMAVPHEKKTFIIDSVNEDGTAGTFAGTFRFSTNGESSGVLKVNTNPTLDGDQVAFANAVFTNILEANKSYFVMQVRDHDWLEFDSTKFPDLAGCENGSASCGGITVQTCEWGDINTRVSTMRIDVPYVAKGIDPRLSRIAYVEV